MVTSKYDNILLMGDLNIDANLKTKQGYKDLINFMDMYNFSNLIKSQTCHFKDNSSSIDVMLTNKPRRFFNSNSFELGVSDCHTMITSFLRTQISRLRPKNITYRSFKKYDRTSFLNELNTKLSNFEVSDVNVSFDNLTNIIVTTLDKYAPLKTKTLRGNQASFMNKNLSKAIMTRSKLKAKYIRTRNFEDKRNFKKQRNLCVNLKKKCNFKRFLVSYIRFKTK
jgi:hypothetical protein